MGGHNLHFYFLFLSYPPVLLAVLALGVGGFLAQRPGTYTLHIWSAFPISVLCFVFVFVCVERAYMMCSPLVAPSVRRLTCEKEHEEGGRAGGWREPGRGRALGGRPARGGVSAGGGCAWVGRGRWGARGALFVLIISFSSFPHIRLHLPIPSKSRTENDLLTVLSFRQQTPPAPAQFLAPSDTHTAVGTDSTAPLPSPTYLTP